MKPITRPFSSLTRNRRSRAKAGKTTDGYALIVVMIAVTVLAIGLLAVLPSTYQESRREKEDELIFRGNQYARAIYLFQQRFHRYPASVKELLHTNNLSFLRKAWPDPMTPGGKWRFIHATGSGALLDSWTLGPQQGPSPLGQNTAAGAGGQSAFGSSGVSPGMMPPQGGFGGSQAGGGFGFSSTSGPSSSSSSQPGQSGSAGSGRPTDSSGKPIQSPDCVGGGQTGPTSAFFSSGNQPQGAAIAGVASCNDAASLRIYNKYTHYSEWEFLGVGFNPALGAGIAPPSPVTAPVTTPSGPGGSQSQPGQTGAGGPPASPPGAMTPGGGIALPAVPGPPETPIPDPEPPPDTSGPPQQ
jgi:type II secretory pathway pseudopilin PulG